MHLGMFLQGAGHHLAGWRYPGADSGSENIPHLVRQAVTAERAKFDMVFLADGLTSSEDGHPSQIARFEPLMVLATFATATSRIGLAATASTTYGEPFHLARAFASLDHMSHGRAAWNAVTTSYTSTGANFGVKHPAHADRYAIAEEFIDVVRGLWDSWDDGAFPKDKATGIYADQSKRHVLDHKGQYFSVKGPLNVSRPPQGHPIIIQSGSSEPGQQLAARTADVVFTAHQTLESAQAFYRELKGRLAAFGRRPESLAIMPGFLPVLGGTEQEARDKLALLDSWTDQSKVIAHAVGPVGARRLGLRSRRAVAGAAGLRAVAESGEAAHRRGAARQPHAAPARPDGRDRPRPLRDVRHARADRRPDGIVVPRGRGGRLQRDAAVFPRRPRRFRQGRHPDPAKARPVPDRIRRADAARPFRLATPAKPASPSPASGSARGEHVRSAPRPFVPEGGEGPQWHV